ADSGMLDLSKDIVKINEMAGTAFELFKPAAEMKNIEFNLKLPTQPVIVSGDVNRLQRVISNLLDNSIKYTPEKGRIMISVDSGDSCVQINVSDTGCGISEADVKNIFDRFFRCDTSRSQPGNGLGLSLAQSIVKAHGGIISVESKLGAGSSFKVSLPVHSSICRMK
ncbi:MAG: HAMP domain-containing sensor histidine kinase, partial [Lentisphaerota bacterium]